MAKRNFMNSVELFKPKRNVFDLTHDFKFSCNMGELVPIMVQECIPGDKFNLGCEALTRFAPMVAPVMHRMDVTMHYFFVPNRILWENWPKFIMNEKSPSVPPPFPTINQEPFSVQRLANYLGIPLTNGPDDDTSTAVSAMPFAAYQCIWNEFYRDQNLQPEIAWKLTDGDNSSNAALTELRRRAWGHDYFTSALPWPQKGDGVDIPLGDVVLKDPPALANTLIRDVSGNLIPAGTDNIRSTGGALNVAGVGGQIDPNGTLEVEATTINTLRRAFKLQEWLERNARGGTRYIENILAHFGVKSSDARLQRPEYITGIKSPVVISEILNTTGTDDLPQGNMSGHGVSVTANNHNGSYFCEEHGFIIGVMSVIPLTAYMQGIPKHFLKTKDFTQYFWPSFAHLGEQEIENRELFAWRSNGEETFGYTPRYAEYRYNPSRVAGDFAKENNLDTWHLARRFETPPTLSGEFIACNPTTRIFAVEDPDVQKLYCHVLNKVKAIRPIPVYGSPAF